MIISLIRESISAIALLLQLLSEIIITSIASYTIMLRRCQATFKHVPQFPTCLMISSTRANANSCIVSSHSFFAIRLPSSLYTSGAILSCLLAQIPT